MPRFSVTIPSYKGRFLYEAIDSVLKQTYQDYELIIVDDCSPEDLHSIVNRFTDNRIRYYRNDKNCGSLNVVDNWNICLGFCSGDYVICMGDDDRLLPWCLEEYSKLIDKYPNLCVFHAWTQQIDEEGKVVRLLQPRPEKESFFELTYHRWTGRLQYIGDFCYEVHYLRENNGYYKLPLAWGSDDITAARAALDKGIANTSKPCFEYRTSQMTISNSSNYTQIKLESIIRERQWYDSILEQINEDQLSDVDKWYFQALLKVKDVNSNNKMFSEMIIDIHKNLFNIFRWFVKCPEYGMERVFFLKKIVMRMLFV